MNIETQINELIILLDKAENLAGQFSGGYSNEFFSAEDFHAALVESIKNLKNGDHTQLNKIWIWFAPTSSWDDFIGLEGLDLGNLISEVLNQLVKDTTEK